MVKISTNLTFFRQFLKVSPKFHFKTLQLIPFQATKLSQYQLTSTRYSTKNYRKFMFIFTTTHSHTPIESVFLSLFFFPHATRVLKLVHCFHLLAAELACIVDRLVFYLNH